MASGAAVMALALAMTVMMTGCSTEGDSMTDRSGKGQLQKPKTASIRVTVSAGISDDAGATASGDEGTRSEVVSTTNSETGKTTRTLTFSEGDKLYVHKSGIGAVSYVAGTLTVAPSGLSDDGKSATFTGDLVAYGQNGDEYTGYNFGDDPLAGTKATLIHAAMTPSDYGFTAEGTIHFNQFSASSVEELMTKYLVVEGNYDSSNGYTLANSRPIFNCALSGLTASTTYTLTLQSSDGGGTDSDINYFMTTDDTGAGTIAFIPNVFGSHEWNITVTKGDLGFNGTISLGTMAINPAKIYNVYRHWNTAGTYAGFSKTIDLSKLGNDVTVRNGMTLTDDLSLADSRHRVSIAAGATVTLSNATILGTANIYSWAGLTCLGDATIVLADGTTNKVAGSGIYPGIHAGPAGTTLTIRGGAAGTGSLTAESHIDADGISGSAGIGGGQNMTVGNIRIEGGHITAIGDDNGAGIGCGQNDGASANASCGDITITGGEVTATGGSNGAGIGSGGQGAICGNISITGGEITATGGDYGAGIGSGAYDALCGNITISGGEITANGGSLAAGIGCGHYGSCGDITITGGTGTATGDPASPNDIGEGVGGYCFSVSVADGTIISASIRYACTFTVKYFASYSEQDNMVHATPVYNVNSTLIIDIRGRQYITTAKYKDGDEVTINLPAVSGGTLQVSTPNDTPYDNSQYSSTSPRPTAKFVGTLTNVTITPTGTNNLGTVNLVMQ